MLTDEEIFTAFNAESTLNREVASAEEMDGIVAALLLEAQGDPAVLAALPEPPEPVLEAARDAFTADVANTIAALYAGHCQRRVEIDDYDADGHGGVYVAPDAWPIGDASADFDLAALSTALHEGGTQ